MSTPKLPELFERWGRFSGFKTWPRTIQDSPHARIFGRWPELSYLYARDELSRTDPGWISPRDHVHIRLEVGRIKQSGNKNGRSWEPLRTFDHYMLEEDLQKDATSFNRALYRNLKESMPDKANPRIRLRIRYFTPTSTRIDPETKRRVSRQWLHSWTGEWL